MKYIYKHSDKIFSSLLYYLNYKDEEFTYKSCIEITKYIDDISYYNGSEFVKLFNLILPVLSIKDNFQQIRFEIIIGLPQLVTEENPSKFSFPLIGYHVLGDDNGKYIEYKGLINIKNTCTVIRKINMLKMKGVSAIQAFLSLLNNCKDNHELLKYIRKVPSEEPKYGSFIDFGISLINTFGAKNESNNHFFDQLSDIVDKINPIMDNIMTDDNILNGYRGFVGKYLIKDIKREEISLKKHIDNVFLFQIDYYTNTIEGDNIDYKLSKSYVSGSMNLLEDDDITTKSDEHLTINDDENIKTLTDDEALIDATHKLNLSEREFFKKISPSFNKYKKIIVENKYSIPGSTHTIRRYVVYNSNLSLI